MALVRFGRVSERRAVISLDGEIEGIEADSDARTTVAADIICGVERAHEPAFCGACGTALADGRRRAPRVRRRPARDDAPHRPRPAPGCAEALRGRPPAFCTACGAAYEAEGMQHQADELLLAYTCTCPAGPHGLRHQRRLRSALAGAYATGGGSPSALAASAGVPAAHARTRGSTAERAKLSAAPNGSGLVADVVPIEDELAERRVPVRGGRRELASSKPVGSRVRVGVERRLRIRARRPATSRRRPPRRPSHCA